MANTFRKALYSTLAVAALGIGIVHIEQLHEKKKRVTVQVMQQTPQKPVCDIVTPKPQRTPVRNVADIQSLLGVSVDGMLGPQTNYALDSLLLDLQVLDGKPFHRSDRNTIEDHIYDDINTTTTQPKNIEAVAFAEFGEYCMSRAFTENHQNFITTKDEVREFFDIRPDFFDAQLIAFKTAMNYKHHLSMPITTTLDETTFIALNYAKHKRLDYSLTSFSLSHCVLKTSQQAYTFFIPMCEELSTKYFRAQGTAIDPYDPIVRSVAHSLAPRKGTSEQDAHELLKFVQSIPYVPDVGGAHFSRHPIRSLLERGMDCEDSVDMYVSLLRSRGRDAVRFVLRDIPPNGTAHAMAGVAGKFQGSSITHKSRKYYIADTLTEGWKIGENPYTQDGIKWSVE